MFKWISIIAGSLATAGGICLAVGAAPVTLLVSAVVGGLGIISLASGVVYLTINNSPENSNKIQSQYSVPCYTNSINHNNITSISSQKISSSQKSKLEAGAVQLKLAQTYSLELNEKKRDSKKAFDCYLEAAKLGHLDALSPLERLGEEMSSEKQMELSQLYGSFFNNHEKANYWRTKAKEVEQFNFNM